MNFPMEEPIFQFLYWLMNTPGLGSIALMAMMAALSIIFFSTLRWIHRGGAAPETVTYAYPTPALHLHKQEGKS